MCPHSFKAVLFFFKSWPDWKFQPPKSHQLTINLKKKPQNLQISVITRFRYMSIPLVCQADELTTDLSFGEVSWNRGVTWPTFRNGSDCKAVPFPDSGSVAMETCSRALCCSVFTVPCFKPGSPVFSAAPQTILGKNFCFCNSYLLQTKLIIIVSKRLNHESSVT